MKVTEKVITEGVADIICDMCNESCKKEYNIEHGQLTADWGYESTRDGDSVDIHLCENCFGKVEEFIKQNQTAIFKEKLEKAIKEGDKILNSRPHYARLKGYFL